MRVIGGTARGTKLECPSGEQVRPLSDMARQALFNILRERVERAQVLDLFAGVGSVGIEALSRGAARCTFVELSERHANFLRRNLQRTRLADRSDVIVQDAFRCVGSLGRSAEHFDIVYLGPPFALLKDPSTRLKLIALLDQLVASNVLNEGGVLILQHDRRDILPDRTERLRRIERRDYGRNCFSFYAALETNNCTESAEVLKPSS